MCPLRGRYCAKIFRTHVISRPSDLRCEVGVTLPILQMEKLSPRKVKSLCLDPKFKRQLGPVPKATVAHVLLLCALVPPSGHCWQSPDCISLAHTLAYAFPPASTAPPRLFPVSSGHLNFLHHSSWRQPTAQPKLALLLSLPLR